MNKEESVTTKTMKALANEKISLQHDFLGEKLICILLSIN